MVTSIRQQGAEERMERRDYMNSLPCTDTLAALIDQIKQEDRTRIKAKTDLLKN